MTKTIRVFAKKSKDGKFYQFSFKGADDISRQIKFKRDVNPKVEGNGYYLLEIEQSDMSLQKQSYVKDNERKNCSVIWVSNLVSFKRDVEYEQSLNEEYKEILASILG